MTNDEEESESFTCKLVVTLPSNTPVVGIEIAPHVLVRQLPSLQLSQHTVTFTWYRQQISFPSCKFGDSACFAKKWIDREVCHHRGAEESEWVEVGRSKSYIPTLDDLGSCLRLESIAADPISGARLSSGSFLDTKPVITPPVSRPRRVVECPNIEAVDCSGNDVAFTVLSYNVLADLYARIGSKRYRYCPTWARVWEYRRENLLLEIIGYDADILCLQEVQSDHFEDFFEPELTKYGYSVLYKKKAMQLYASNKYVSEGCATFYRRTLFKEITKHELEFDKMALQFIQALGHNVKSSHRLSKENIALVTLLETLDNESYQYTNLVRSTICVANTHISASSEYPDVKLFQVVKLVNELEEIVHSGIPLIICGDFNSIPLSDPHKFIVTGSCNPEFNEKQDPLGVFHHLNLQHSLPLASAYASFPVSDDDEECPTKINSETNEPIFTYLTPNTPRTLDYIFYTENNLRVEGLLDLLDRKGLGPGLLSPYWPSDHISLMARFRVLNEVDATKPQY